MSSVPSLNTKVQSLSTPEAITPPSLYKKAAAFMQASGYQFVISMYCDNEIGAKFGNGNNQASFALRMAGTSGNAEIIKGLSQQGKSPLGRLVPHVLNVGSAVLSDVSVCYIREGKAPLIGQTTALAAVGAAGATYKEIVRAGSTAGNQGKAAILFVSGTVCAASAVFNRIYDNGVFKLLLTSGVSQMFSKSDKALALGQQGNTQRRVVLLSLAAQAAVADVITGSLLAPTDPHQNRWVTATTGVAALTALTVAWKLKQKKNPILKQIDGIVSHLEKTKAALEKHRAVVVDGVNTKQSIRLSEVSTDPKQKVLEDSITALSAYRKEIADLFRHFDECVGDRPTREAEQMKAFVEDHAKTTLKETLRPVLRSIRENLVDGLQIPAQDVSIYSTQAEEELQKAIHNIDKALKLPRALKSGQKVKKIGKNMLISAVPTALAMGIVTVSERVLMQQIDPSAAAKTPVIETGTYATLSGINKMVVGSQIKSASNITMQVLTVTTFIAGVVAVDSLFKQEWPSLETFNEKAVEIGIGTASLFAHKILRKAGGALVKGYKAARNIDAVGMLKQAATIYQGSQA